MRGFCLMLLAGLSLAMLSSSPAHAQRVVLVAGGGGGGDGSPAVSAKLLTPFGATMDGDGNIYLVEYAGCRVRKIDARGIISTLAGNGQKGFAGDGGLAAGAQFNSPHNLLVGPDGALYVADTMNNRVRRIDLKTGTISTFAGTGQKGFGGDGGPAEKAQFGNIYSIAFDPKGERMILDDLDNRRVRAIDMKTDVVSTVAGNGEKGVPRDGAVAAKSPLVDPRAATIDGAGNVYILERSGNALRVVDAAGKIRTVVGTGKPGATGDGGPARQATLNGPKHLCIDAHGNVIIADTENHLIRAYRPSDGTIVRIAGTGKKGTAGVGGPPEKLELNRPHGVYATSDGVLYICDSENERVLRLEK